MIQLDIISGFLGAGKTTLANILLTHYVALGERVVYVVNEFGDTYTDAALMRSEGFSALTLPNGCICCSLKTDLVLALRNVIKAFSPTRIVFETSGIFIYDHFEDVLKDEVLSTCCRVRRTVAVADSLNILHRAALAGSFVENQLINASVIAISKLERFEGDMDELFSELKHISPNAALIAVPWSEEGFVEQFLSAGEAGGRVFVSGHGHAHFDAVNIRPIRDLTHDSAYRFLREAVDGGYGNLLRAKGVVRINGVLHRLNIAMNDVVMQPVKSSDEPRLTFIGHGLDESALKKLFERACDNSIKEHSPV